MAETLAVCRGGSLIGRCAALSKSTNQVRTLRLADHFAPLIESPLHNDIGALIRSRLRGLTTYGYDPFDHRRAARCNPC